MTDLLSLAARVEQLTGRCREIDALIAAALRIVPDGHPWLSRWTGEIRATGHCVQAFNDKGESSANWIPPRFTASLDAAMTLLVAGWEWEITNLYGHAQVNLPLNSRERGWQQVSRKDDNVILALVECILRARAALEGSHG